MEHYKKNKRVYLTSKSYLKKVRLICIFAGIFGFSVSAVMVLILGITFTSLGIVAGIGLLTLFFIRFIWTNARSVSLKAGNIILKTMNDQNVVAPIGSIREASTRSVVGYQFTRIRYHIDGSLSKFFILTKTLNDTPESLIKEEIAASRRKKKEANRKPDSVLTQTA